MPIVVHWHPETHFWVDRRASEGSQVCLLPACLSKCTWCLCSPELGSTKLYVSSSEQALTPGKSAPPLLLEMHGIHRRWCKSSSSSSCGSIKSRKVVEWLSGFRDVSSFSANHRRIINQSEACCISKPLPPSHTRHVLLCFVSIYGPVLLSTSKL